MKYIRECWPSVVFVRTPILALLCFGFWGMGASQGNFMDWLREWQSMIGAVISAALAVALFQIQRHLDRRAQRKSLMFSAVRALTRIKSHYENVKVPLAKATLERIRERAKVPRTVIAVEQDQKAVINCITDIIMLFGKYTDILSAIPRDQVLAYDIINQIDDLDEAFELTQKGFVMLLEHAGPQANWGGMDENGVPMIIVNALSFLEDISEQYKLIDSTLRSLQNSLA